MFLSKTPAVRRLEISMLRPDLDFVQSNDLPLEGLVLTETVSLPYLQEYFGPHEVLPVLFGRSTSSTTESSSIHLSLAILTRRTQNLDAFVNSLRLCDPVPLGHVTELRIEKLKEMDRDSLATICVMFSGLQELCLDASLSTNQQGFLFVSK
jgi:hypothetical protein